MVEFWIHYYHKALTFVSFELLTPTGRGFKVVKAKQIEHKNEWSANSDSDWLVHVAFISWLGLLVVIQVTKYGAPSFHPVWWADEWILLFVLLFLLFNTLTPLRLLSWSQSDCCPWWTCCFLIVFNFPSNSVGFIYQCRSCALALLVAERGNFIYFIMSDIWNIFYVAKQPKMRSFQNWKYISKMYTGSKIIIRTGMFWASPLHRRTDRRALTCEETGKWSWQDSNPVTITLIQCMFLGDSLNTYSTLNQILSTMSCRDTHPSVVHTAPHPATT